MKRNRGFTLVELIVALAVSSIIVAGSSLAIMTTIRNMNSNAKINEAKIIGDKTLDYILDKVIYAQSIKVVTNSEKSGYPIVVEAKQNTVFYNGQEEYKDILEHFSLKIGLTVREKSITAKIWVMNKKGTEDIYINERTNEINFIGLTNSSIVGFNGKEYYNWQIMESGKNIEIYNIGVMHNVQDFLEKSSSIADIKGILTSGMSGDKKTKELQSEFKKEFEGGLPPLSTEEKNILKSLGYGAVDILNWRPMISKEGEIFMVCSGASADRSHVNGNMIYYKNNFYVWAHYGQVKDTWISDAIFNISVLQSGKTTKDIKTLTGNGQWLRYVP